MEKKFQEDLDELYEIVSLRQKELGEWFKIVESEGRLLKQREFIDDFLKQVGLERTKENRLSALTRLIALRDDQLVQSLTNENFSGDYIDEVKQKAYIWVKDFYIKRYEELLDTIEEKKLLNEFYRALLRGVHLIGIEFSNWQTKWTNYIIKTQNIELKKKFGDRVIEFLNSNGLYDIYKDGKKADRAYSVLVRQEDEKYSVESYAEFFRDEVKRVLTEIEKLLRSISTLEDPDTNQKYEYINYFIAIKDALSETRRDELVKRWQDVDRAWMKIVSPIQVGHPLEYYEDHYRKAVALEWDVRITNTKNLDANKTYENILFMYRSLFKKIGKQRESVFNLTLTNLERVNLYIGRPALFYASEFNGLFSAQVVPNDEEVTKEHGKKIFAFSDNILDSLRAKPFLKIQTKIFGKEFMQKERELVFKKEELWHKVYEISTIGHEYGHILWLDNDTETRMNRNGVFKNIEEFKATAGGLVAFFMNEDENISEYVLRDIIKRAVGLIAWMQTNEVQPYYCEGLIHLSGLFESGTLMFEDELKIDLSKKNILKEWYISCYESLATHYLEKRDAKEFLDRYAILKSGVYKPIREDIEEFVDYYWGLHKSIGRVVDEDIIREDWVC